MDLSKNIRKRVNTPTAEMQTTNPLLKKSSAYEELQFPKSEIWFVRRERIKCYWAIPFVCSWLLLYFFISIPAYHRLPKPLTIKDEPSHPDRFIAEQAEIYLKKLVLLGPRVVGSTINEKLAVKFFMGDIQRIRTESRWKTESSKLANELEIDVQSVSGSYVYWNMVNMYQGVQNVIVKVSPKYANSSSYLLVNSHFDSVPGGPGAGDDGAMVAIMLECIRVLMKSNTPLKHPVVFLFNGAEENPLQASHGFITQHKWAKNVKALINLDSAGNGGREILFQSGPNHPWLMKHYRKAIVHPYASTVAEEMFQKKLIPSDTDFRIFRDHGHVPGLDMAHQYNGYVYHTKYDLPDILPRATLQNTGDNVLALIREFSNASEMEDPSKFSEGHTIFFDYMGIFLVFYSEFKGIIINFLVSIVGIITCFVSFQMMATGFGVKLSNILMEFLHTFGIQVVAVIAATALCFSVAILMDLLHMPMSWFTNSWLILGLYFCPLFFCLAIVPNLYFQKKNDRLPMGYRVKMLLHSHCLFLCAVTMILTICQIRSAFMLTIAIFFYTIGLVINIATSLHDTPLLWLFPHVLCAIPPFLYYAYISHGFFVTFIPMTGRFGPSVNPDLIICSFSVGVGILTGGFMIPVLNLFHKSKTIICSFLVVMFVFIIMATTSLGFPYRDETNVQRFSVLHTRRVFHDANNAVRRIETGYFIMPQDRRIYSVKGQLINATLARSIGDDCKTEMLCGLPLYNHRWHKNRAQSVWIPGPEPKFDMLPEINIIEKKNISKTKIRYEMLLKGPDHMGIFIRPLDGAEITNWSFHHVPLRMNWKPPYFIYFSYGADNSPLKFWIEIENSNGNLDGPNFEIGLAGHWTHHEHMYTPDFKKFLASFPKYVDAQAWPASYVTWIF